MLLPSWPHHHSIWQHLYSLLLSVPSLGETSNHDHITKQVFSGLCMEGLFQVKLASFCSWSALALHADMIHMNHVSDCYTLYAVLQHAKENWVKFQILQRGWRMMNLINFMTWTLNFSFFYFQLVARGSRNSTQLTFDTLGFLLDRGKVLFYFS